MIETEFFQADGMSHFCTVNADKTKFHMTSDG